MKTMKLVLSALVMIASTNAFANEAETGESMDLDLAVSLQAASEEAQLARREFSQTVTTAEVQAAAPIVITLDEVL